MPVRWQIGVTRGSGPFDIALDKDGNVYVVDRDNNRIEKFGPTGKFLSKIGGESSTKGKGLFFQPTHVAIDGQGNIYVLDGFYLQKFDASGNFIAQWATHGGDLNDASTLAVDW